MPYDRLLTDTAGRTPENVAVVSGDVSLTFRELEALTNRFARALARLGVRRGDRVCLLTPNCPEYVVAFYAVARVGAVTVENPLVLVYAEGQRWDDLNLGMLGMEVLSQLVVRLDPTRRRVQFVEASAPRQ